VASEKVMDGANCIERQGLTLIVVYKTRPDYDLAKDGPRSN
jgi:hypothetical protein